MSLLHKAGMSSSLGEFVSWSTSLAYVWICLVSWGSVVDGLLIFGIGSICLAVFLSRVMRLRCLASDFVMTECSLVLVSDVDG